MHQHTLATHSTNQTALHTCVSDTFDNWSFRDHTCAILASFSFATLSVDNSIHYDINITLGQFSNVWACLRHAHFVKLFRLGDTVYSVHDEYKAHDYRPYMYLMSPLSHLVDGISADLH